MIIIKILSGNSSVPSLHASLPQSLNTDQCENITPFRDDFILSMCYGQNSSNNSKEEPVISKLKLRIVQNQSCSLDSWIRFSRDSGRKLKLGENDQPSPSLLELGFHSGSSQDTWRSDLCAEEGRHFFRTFESSSTSQIPGKLSDENHCGCGSKEIQGSSRR